jgi:hypothetical protein
MGTKQGLIGSIWIRRRLSVRVRKCPNGDAFGCCPYDLKCSVRVLGKLRDEAPNSRPSEIVIQK